MMTACPIFSPGIYLFPMNFPMENRATLVFPGDAPAPKSVASGKQRGPGGPRALFHMFSHASAIVPPVMHSSFYEVVHLQILRVLRGIAVLILVLE